MLWLTRIGVIFTLVYAGFFFSLQATVLERVVMTAERSVHKLSRASGVRLATNLQVMLS